MILGLALAASTLTALAGEVSAQGYTAAVQAQLQNPPNPPIQYAFPNGSYAEFLAGNEQSVGFGATTANAIHPFLWDSTGAVHDYQPASGYSDSQMTGTDGTYQAGYGTTTGGANAAIEWGGTNAASNLNVSGVGGANTLPAAATGGANAYAVFQNQVVGAYQVPTNLANGPTYKQLAYMWNTTGTPGTAGFTATGVDLSSAPALSGYAASSTNGTNGTNQVGFATDTNPSYPNYHAVVWSANGTVATVLQSSVPGLDSYRAFGISGTQIVGFGNPAGQNSRDNLMQSHAVVWLTAASAPIDLQPATLPEGILGTQAYATNGTLQLGVGYDNNFNSFALLWSGTAASMVDLNALLPAGYNNSIASAFDSTGDIIGLATDPNGNTVYVEWTVVPEPTSLACGAVGLAVIGLSVYRRRRGAQQ